MQDLDWNHMRAFLATVERGSLSAAARQLGLTQPTLSRQIAALEDRLGLLLFERLGKRLQLTQAGQQLAGHVREMGAAADRVGLAASGQSSDISGIVRITAIDVFAAYLLPSVHERIRAMAPGIILEIIASNAVDDLMRREADIAIRHVEPTQPDLIARRCPDIEVGLYAATSLLDRIGRPIAPTDLAEMPFIGYPDYEAMIEHLQKRDIALRAETMSWRCASTLINWELVRRGLGIGIMFAGVGADMTGVEPVLPGVSPLIAPMWLVAHRELHTSPRIRLVFDALHEALSHRATSEEPSA